VILFEFADNCLPIFFSLGSLDHYGLAKELLASKSHRHQNRLCRV